ncbi:MAG: hypothetical protein WAK03_15745 [Methylocystis sp.]|jgi:hypothetical protein
MSKHASELSLAELSQLGADAAGEAADATLARGMPVTGLFPNESGDLKLARRYADGSIEWIVDDPGTGEVASRFKVAG